MRLKNKIAIVTGAGSGFGEGIAKRFCAEGAKVVVNDISETGGGRVVKEIQAAGGTATFFKADVTKGADVQSLVDFAIKEFGGLHIMINNAGWTHRNQPMQIGRASCRERVYSSV